MDLRTGRRGMTEMQDSGQDALMAFAMRGGISGWQVSKTTMAMTDDDNNIML